ncbi:MAG TPA: tRNA preQ1(34) S-adenosylmethionine ribosyltransferase-isomerase QueA [Candidatus Limnocylindria bacterium]|nr:tRNA preQ1(34) S-adenosylmethionine ribosyltransferase-isomerase QueA [Candidatus Limnocylindria bacterium]
MTDASAGRLRVDEFDYELPTEAVAQAPSEPRDASRLIVLDRATSRPGRPVLAEGRFADIGEWLSPGDLLVVNDSRVLRARLRGTRAGGGEAEVLLLRPLADGRWEALVRPGRRLRPGAPVTLATGDRLTIGETVGEGTRAVTLPRDPVELMTDAGEMPLPPYITAREAPDERYQTVFAVPPGSAAAPTAGLHFTPRLLDELRAAGVERAAVTLHVGLDTFQPLDGTFVDEHRIHREWYVMPPSTRRAIATARAQGRRVVAVGTTTTRVLETVARTDAAEGWTDLYIVPPHAYRSVDALITNFHLPRSSLLLLVTAFVQAGMAGTSPLDARDTLLAAYRAALERGFRFYSFGDAMLIA